ncbi:hypothetical protein F4778DRAFT_788777 [Xylariomycetidae sp. FL2044]|nr:hypothetical protein F4778DRAFT_788777 [Xylariomycetidae sp. FL2044]
MHAVNIYHHDLHADETQEAAITDVVDLTSYGCIKAMAPTIAVPGVPPRWSPPATDPEFDVVTDRDNLRKLLASVYPCSHRSPYDPLRHQRRGDRGYPHLLSEISNSTGYQRIISYRLGGLGFLVRHELGGYVENDDKTITRSGFRISTG